MVLKLSRKLTTLVFVIVVGGMLSFFAFKQTSGPRYEGKPLSEWLQVAYEVHPRSSQRAKAEEAIRSIGTNALPLLLKWTEAKDNRFRDKFESFTERIVPRERARRWSHFLFGRRADEKFELAEKGFEILGEQATPATERLREMAQKGNKAKALLILARIGKSGAPTVLGALADATNENNWAAFDGVAILQSSGVDCSSALPILLNCLAAKNRVVSRLAAEALVSFTNYPDIVIPGVLNNIQSIPDSEIRFWVTRNLGAFRERGRSAVPQLIALLNCTNADFCTNNDFRRAVLHSLRKISPEDVPQEWVTNSIPRDDKSNLAVRWRYLPD
jgi:hypothetical protein